MKAPIMNKNCFIIDNVAIFYPSERHITSLRNGNRIKLNAPTSQLLEAFIKNIGVIITQSELFTAAWGDNAVNVTPNTLYQNVSLLRKALQDAGIKGDYLTTIRGQGFFFKVSSISEKDTYYSESEEVNIKNKTVIRKTHIILFISLLAIIAVSGFIFNKISHNQEYAYLSSQNTCKIHTKTNQMNDLLSKKINLFLESKSLDCSGYNYVYFNFSDIHPTISLTLCESDINNKKKGNDCKNKVFYNHRSII
ncbi:winged helix-turn-helix domain-containing protein [Yersinia enterocolitica]|uniref:winged helix-turn-helix domain-containing protein n=1 Tax=Yersinia enterocolitica TaxID=630 RepID=UPI00398C889B